MACVDSTVNSRWRYGTVLHQKKVIPLKFLVVQHFPSLTLNSETRVRIAVAVSHHHIN